MRNNELSNRVIYVDDECLYGFLDDIINDFTYYLNGGELTEVDIDLYTDLLKNAYKLKLDDDNYNVLFKVVYNPMGAYFFTKMVEDRNLKIE